MFLYNLKYVFEFYRKIITKNLGNFTDENGTRLNIVDFSKQARNLQCGQTGSSSLKY